MSEDPKLIIRVINFELVQLTCPRYVNVTDGRTDGQTDGRLTITIPRYHYVHTLSAVMALDLRTTTLSGFCHCAQLISYPYSDHHLRDKVRCGQRQILLQMHRSGEPPTNSSTAVALRPWKSNRRPRPRQHYSTHTDRHKRCRAFSALTLQKRHMVSHRANHTNNYSCL